MGSGDDERTPLVLHEDHDVQFPINGGGEGNEVLVAPIDEFPPPSYNAITGDTPTVTCRVCQSSIDISGKREQHVVKCSNCNEATPIRNPPVGRKYVRCPCFCLLICKNTSLRIACPRPNCKRVISLAPATPVRVGIDVPNLPGMCRVTCAHCHDSFLFNALNNALARCPHCRKISSVGGDYSKKRGIIFTLLGIVLLVLTLAIMFGTLSEAPTKTAFYGLYLFLFIGSAIVMLRGIYYCSMKVSSVEGPESSPA